jgi:hypothetical protein
MRKPRFLPFWLVGLGVLLLYVGCLLVTLNVDRFVPALPHLAALGEASALVGSFLTVISTFFLLYTIYLQQRIRDEQATELHWFELLKRWPEVAQDEQFKDHANDYEGELVKVELAFRIDNSADGLSEQKGLEAITEILNEEGNFRQPPIAERIDHLFAAMMTLRQRIRRSGQALFDNSFLPFVSQQAIGALVYSALFRADRNFLRWLTELGLAERALTYAPETRWLLTRHYGTIQQRKEKARARQREKDARRQDTDSVPADPPPP